MKQDQTPQNNFEITKRDFVIYLHNAFCNGLYYFDSYGLSIDFDDAHYDRAKKMLLQEFPKQVICIEDVLIKMLELKLPIFIKDDELDEYNVTLDLDELYSNYKLIPNENLSNIINETDDAIDSDAFLQSVIFQEIVFC
jgi:hypothetical protein